MNPLDGVEKFPAEILASNKDIMIIGHLPFLQKLAGRLLTGSEKREIIAYKNSGLVSLDYDDQKWKIDLLVSPDHL
jgi:phosphohistidine phosphatase